MSREELFGVKILALLHDPPDKMWLLKPGVVESHEKRAAELARELLSGTVLGEVYEKYRDRYAPLVKRIDSIVSTFDRWFLSLSWRWEKPYKIFYARLHNIFNPRLSVRLREPSEQGVKEFVRDVRRLLERVEKEISIEDKDRKVLVEYTLFYLTYEAQWYSKRLDPSLADTRSPNHTIFDHLYASASIANIVAEKGFNGYYVLVDYPGVQRFVYSGRKIGDLWVSSWILSNLAWSIGDGLAKEHGLDIILTPTPRLNPYSYKTLLSMLSEEKNVYTATCPEEADGSIESEICDLLETIYSVKAEEKQRAREYVNRLLTQPLVPAYMTLLLPRSVAKDPQELASRIQARYRDSWEDLYETVLSSLRAMLQSVREDGESIMIEYLYERLSKLGDILRLPPQGLKVSVVDISRVYEDLEKCLLARDKDTCGKLWLNIDFERVNEVISDISGVDKEFRDKIERELPQILLYYLLATRGPELAKRYGAIVHSIPRVFSFYDESKSALSTILESDEMCSLCAEEPAVFRAPKRATERGVDYDEEHGDIREILNRARMKGISREDVKRELEVRVAKPGEALGPYCLFKRAAYVAYSKRLGVLTTDAIANLRSLKLGRRYKDLLKKFFESLESEGDGLSVLGELIKNLYSSKLDLELLARIVSLTTRRVISVEELIRILRKAYEEICSGNHISSVVTTYDSIKKLYSLETSLARGILSANKVNVERIDPRLCTLFAPRTSYAIIVGDADNIGDLLLGRLEKLPLAPRDLREYVGVVLDKLSGAEIDPREERDRVLESLRRGFKHVIELVEALGVKGLIISPAWHAAISLSIMLSAVDEYKIVSRLGGFLVFSGGDDTLAITPVQTALAIVRELRKAFWGDKSSGFKRINGSIVSSALITGKSFSVRFAGLWDVMSEEIYTAREFLEKYAKNSIWALGRFKWVKDSTVISDSRSGERVVIPNRIYNSIALIDPFVYIDLITSLLITDTISGNTPEDFEEYSKGVLDKLSCNEIAGVLEYILGRNIKKKVFTKIEDSLREVFTGVLCNTSNLADKARANLAVDFIRLIKILRNYTR